MDIDGCIELGTQLFLGTGTALLAHLIFATYVVAIYWINRKWLNKIEALHILITHVPTTQNLPDDSLNKFKTIDVQTRQQVGVGAVDNIEKIFAYAARTERAVVDVHLFNSGLFPGMQNCASNAGFCMFSTGKIRND
jgi:hypothetical protein